MLRPGRAFSVTGVVLALIVFGPATAAHARGGLQRCLDRAVNHGGVPPTCTKVNGTWVASWPGEGASGSGATGAIVFLAVIGALVGLGVLAWKVSTARRLASQSGMDPNLATQMTLLTDDGLESTYLAANLRPAPQSAAPSPSPPPAAERLTELTALLDRGMITQAEYDESRRAIIGSV
ncbi:SHOCT domain-containing protein [Nocardioides panaciterrulae]|uniref:SHOCT domain-containing protein n=1 Tax=Nocardioides panaciterrulae TaxID=661492 RepID=A0A7Y9JBL9_9ACTN|nr:SHOCT domain-containing protein [Nocardioides panaciterrulae]NYD42937.1 hypothetical protein [Nocardioides panaciterrulae]